MRGENPPSFFIARRKNLSFVVFFSLYIIAISLLSAEGIHVRDTDIFYHLNGGRYMWEKGEVLNREIVSFTRGGKEWVNYYWLFEVVVYGFYKAGGYKGVVFLRFIIMILTGLLIFFIIYKMSSENLLVSMALAPAVFILYGARAINIRPHIFSYLFLLLFLKILDDFFRRDKNRLYLLPLIQILWINLHGVEYPFAFFLIGAYIFQSMIPYMRKDVKEVLKSKKFVLLSISLITCIVVSFINPFHYRVFGTPMIALTEETMRNIGEMIPMKVSDLLRFYPSLGKNIHFFLSLLFVAGIFLVPFALIKGDAKYPLIFGVTLVLLFRRNRFYVEFALLTAPFVGYYLSQIDARLSMEKKRVSAIIFLLITIYGLFSVFHNVILKVHDGKYRVIGEEIYPTGAVEFIKKENLQGNLFNAPSFGGYIEWELYPQVKISMDMRTPDPFDNEIFWLVRKVQEGKVSPEDFSSRWDVDFFLTHSNSPLSYRLVKEKGRYALVYVDEKFAVFLKRDKFPEDKVQKIEIKFIDPFNLDLRGKTQAELEGIREEAERLLNYWDRNTLAYRILFNLFIEKKKWNSAIEVLNEVKQKVKWLDLSIFYGIVYFKKGDLKKAEKYLLQAVKRKKNPEGVRYLAKTLFDLKKYKECIKLLRNYEEIRGFRLNTEEYILLGDAYRAVGDIREAKHYYMKSYWKSDAEQEKEVVRRLREIGVDI